MKSAGYVTGAVGKWHLGAHALLHPNRRGFEHYFGLLGGGHQYFDHNQFLTNPAKAKQEYLIPLVRNETPVAEQDYLTDALGREAAAFVESHRGKPFFLYLAFNAPHTPLQAPEKYLDRVSGIADQKRRTYGAMVCGMDDAVGRLTAKLAEHKLDQNTLIIFCSDNGGPVSVTNCSNAPLRGAKGQVYDGGVRVPFVVSWPARIKPARCDLPVSSLDVFQTAFAATGREATWKVRQDGVNLLPHLTGQAVADALANRTLFWRTGGGASFAIRQGNMKLVRMGTRPAELYDLSTDIGEEKNIAESRAEVVSALEKRLDAWNSGLVAPLWQSPQAGKKKAPGRQ
jgi:arylsulfatase A-like enzyme